MNIDHMMQTISEELCVSLVTFIKKLPAQNAV